MPPLVDRLRRRIAAERWIVDAAKRHPRSRQLRGLIEQKRSRRIIADTGSVDAALDQIVARAIERGQG